MLWIVALVAYVLAGALMAPLTTAAAAAFVVCFVALLLLCLTDQLL